MSVCRVCGDDGPNVRPGVAQWAEAQDGKTWEAILRCPDREACSGRVAAAGRVWPLVEARTRPPTGPAPRRSKADLDAELVAWRAQARAQVAEGLMDPRPPQPDPATGGFRFREPLPLPQLPLPDPDPVPPSPPKPPEDPSSWW